MVFSLFPVISVMSFYPVLLSAPIYTSGCMCICVWGQTHRIWYRSPGDVNCHGCTDVSKDTLISSSRWFAFLYVKSTATRCCFNFALRHCRQMLMQTHPLVYVQIYVLPCSTHCKQRQELDAASCAEIYKKDHSWSVCPLLSVTIHLQLLCYRS